MGTFSQRPRMIQHILNLLQGEGYSRVDMNFTGALNVHQTGHSMFYLDRFQEQYLVPFPSFKVKGFFSAHLYPDIDGTYHVISSSGYISEITYSGKRFFGGSKNRFEAKLYRRDDAKKTAIYTVSGCWSGEWTIYDGSTGEAMETWSPERHPPTSLEESAPVEEQDPWESRRAWNEVISALKAGEFSRAGAEKLKVEDVQREIRNKNPRYVSDWDPLFFTASHEGRPDFEALASAAPGCELGMDRTNGNWRYDREKADRASKPYHDGRSPVAINGH